MKVCSEGFGNQQHPNGGFADSAVTDVTTDLWITRAKRVRQPDLRMAD